MMAKRSRGSNFCPQEQDFLLSLIADDKHSIENKKTDSVSNKEKDNAWSYIADSVNSHFGNKRTTSALKIWWHNMKKNARKAHAKERVQVFKTGGGVPATNITNDILKKVKDILGISLEGLCNPHNSDSHYNEGLMNESSIEDNGNAENYPCLKELQSCTQNESEWDHRSPGSLKRPMSTALQEASCRPKLTTPQVHKITRVLTTPTNITIKNSLQTQAINNPDKTYIPKSNITSTHEKICNVKASISHTNTPGKYSPVLKNAEERLAEENIKVASLLREHSEAEEKRKTELHLLCLEKEQIAIEILKLDYKRKKIEFEKDFPDI